MSKMLSLSSRLFLTLWRGRHSRVLWRLTGEQHKPYGLLHVQYVPGKGNLAPVSCLHLGGSCD